MNDDKMDRKIIYNICQFLGDLKRELNIFIFLFDCYVIENVLLINILT